MFYVMALFQRTVQFINGYVMRNFNVTVLVLRNANSIKLYYFTPTTETRN